MAGINKNFRRDEETDEIIIYRPDVSILRKKLPTATQYVFYLVWISCLHQRATIQTI